MAHLGFGRTLGSAGPLPMASGPNLFQRSLAVEPGLSQWCPAILPLNRGRGVSFELSHSTLIHSHSLKLCSRVFIGFLLKIWIQETSLSHFFAARKKEQLTGKNIQFGFTNVTRFELHVFLFGVAQARTHPNLCLHQARWTMRKKNSTKRCKPNVDGHNFTF